MTYFVKQPKKYVFAFGDGYSDASELDDMQIEFGDDFSRFHQMTMVGLPVPVGFTINFDGCLALLKGSGEHHNVLTEIHKSVCQIEYLSDGLDYGEFTLSAKLFVDGLGCVETITNIGSEYPWFSLMGSIRELINHIDFSDVLNRVSITVQREVRGDDNDLDRLSGCGIFYTRNPSTGENKPVCDYKYHSDFNAIFNLDSDGLVGVFEDLPQYAQEHLKSFKPKLENLFAAPQALYFVFENGRTHLIQSENDCESVPSALVRSYLDMVESGIVGVGNLMDKVRFPSEKKYHIDDSSLMDDEKPCGVGLPTSPGAIHGLLVFSDHGYSTSSGYKLIYFVDSDDDVNIEIFENASGVISSKGGYASRVSHYCRQFDLPCVVNVECRIDRLKRQILIGDTLFNESDVISIDGNTGLIYPFQIQTGSEVGYDDFVKLTKMKY